MGRATAKFLFASSPGALRRGQKSNIIKYHYISITKSISKIFKPNFVCLLTNISDGIFHSAALVMHQGWDLGVTLGLWGQFFFLKFNQIWCVSYLHEWHMHRHNFLGSRPLGPWGGAKRSNIIKSELQSQFQRFLNQTLCVLSQMKNIKHIRQDFHSATWVMPRGGTWGYPGGLGGPNFFFRNLTRFGMWVTYMNGTYTGTIFYVPIPWGLGEGSKI